MKVMMTYMSLFLFRQNLAIIELRRDYQRIVCALEASCLFAYSSLGRAQPSRPRLVSGQIWCGREAIKEGGVDSIAVSLFGNITVKTREIHIITKEYQNKIQIIILILKRPRLVPDLVRTKKQLRRAEGWPWGRAH